MEYVLSSLEDTMRFASCVGSFVRAQYEASEDNFSFTLYLYGELGAGKTTFTRYFVSAFEGAEHAEVGSPSFTLCHEYPTTPEIYHADLYRLPEACSLPEELQEYTENTILLLEWPERLAPDLRAPCRLELHFQIEKGVHSENLTPEKLDNFENSCEKKRRVTILSYGDKTNDLLMRLSLALQNCFMGQE